MHTFSSETRLKNLIILVLILHLTGLMTRPCSLAFSVNFLMFLSCSSLSLPTTTMSSEILTVPGHDLVSGPYVSEKKHLGSG